HVKADLAVQRAAVLAAPQDLCVLGAVVPSKRARQDAKIRAVLERSAHPQVLYALARARLPGMAHRAFQALLDADPVRALALAEQFGGTHRLEVTLDQWTAIVGHPSESVREQATRLLEWHRVQIA